MSLADDLTRALRLPGTWPDRAAALAVTARHATGADGAELLARARDVAEPLSILLAAGFAGAGPGTAARAEARPDGLALIVEGAGIGPALLPVLVRLMADTHHAVPDPADLAILAEEGVEPPPPILFGRTVEALEAAATPEPGARAIDTAGLSGLGPVALPAGGLPPDLAARAVDGFLDLDHADLPGRALPGFDVEDAVLRLFPAGAFAPPSATDAEEPELWDGPAGLRIAPCRMDAALLAALLPVLPRA